MKNKNWVLQLAIAGCMMALLLSACTQKEDVWGEQDVRALTFTSSCDAFSLNGPQLRTAENAQGETVWSSGDLVSVKAGAITKTYTSDALGNLTSIDPICWTSVAETKTVDAWYPVAKPNLTDQSTNAKYEACNLLKADTKAMTFYGDHALTFKHQMAHVVVNLVNSANAAITNADTLKIYAITDFNYVNGSVTLNSTQSNIIANKTATGFRALLLPQSTVLANEYLMRITIGTRVFMYSMLPSASFTFAQGVTYNFTVKIPV